MDLQPSGGGGSRTTPPTPPPPPLATGLKFSYRHLQSNTNTESYNLLRIAELSLTK